MSLMLAGIVLLVPLRFWQVNQHMTRHTQSRPHFSDDESIEIGFVYRETLVQNDPFLAHPKILLWSQGADKDQLLMETYFPHFIKIGNTGRHFRLPPEKESVRESLSTTEQFLLDRQSR
jgi:hypothetical protein